MATLRRSSKAADRRETLAVEVLEDRRMLSGSATAPGFVYVVNASQYDVGAVDFCATDLVDVERESRRAILATNAKAVSRPAEVAAGTIVDRDDLGNWTPKRQSDLNRAKGGNREMGVATVRDARRTRQWAVYSIRRAPDSTVLTGVVFKDKIGAQRRSTEGRFSRVPASVSAFEARATTAGGWSALVDPQSRYLVSGRSGPFDAAAASIVIEVRAPHVEVDRNTFVELPGKAYA